jgi:ADP-ribosylglycohydrolase
LEYMFLKNWKFVLVYCCFIVKIVECVEGGISSPSVIAEHRADHINAAMLAAASGDALGRVTEFLSLEDIKSKYPKGVHSLKDVVISDMVQDGHSIAPYTDDTRMAICVMQELIKARLWAKRQAFGAKQDIVTYIKEHYDDVCHYIMTNIALSFIKDSCDQWGWTARFRAPGNGCKSAVRSHLMILNVLFHQGYPSNVSLFPRDWWRLSNDRGGCGSVMHAYPFGLVFAEDPELAARLAAEHSYLSHGAPIAVSACAAMAAGTAYALQGLDPKEVVKRMYIIAADYDDKNYKSQTAPLIRQALEFAYDANVRSIQVLTCLEGWSAHEAVAAAAYIFASSPDDIQHALDLGVHTPGDSDSIASLAGALVGARVGMSKVPQGWEQYLEDAQLLSSFGRQVVQI